MEYFITQKTQHSIVEVAAALTQSIKFAAVAQLTSTSTQPSWRNRESVANKSPSLSNDNRCGFPFFLHLLRLVRNTSSATRLFSLPCWRCVTCPGSISLLQEVMMEVCSQTLGCGLASQLTADWRGSTELLVFYVILLSLVLFQTCIALLYFWVKV